MMKVRVLYFAVLRDITGTCEAELVVPEGTTAGTVWQQLRAAHSELSGYQHPPMIAINEEYAGAERLLAEGDELAFIPPVAGG